MRLRRYTRLAGDRVACGDYMLFFCFAMRVVWRLRRYILLVRMIASSPRTFLIGGWLYPHQSRSALGGVNDDGVIYDDCVGADGGLWEIKSM